MKNVFLRMSCLAWMITMVMSNLLHGQIYLNYAVSQPPPLQANAGTDQLVCPGAPANLGGLPTASGGYGGYSYSWSPTTNLNNATAANPIATLTVPTTYILTLQDSLGCLVVDTVVIAIDTCTGFDLMSGIKAFDVFPNPNEGKFTVVISMDRSLDAIALRVVDLAGREVYQQGFDRPDREIRAQIQLRDLSKGTYFIRMEADGKQYSRKMIVR